MATDLLSVPLKKKDLKRGTSLVADIDGCPYPVEVIGTVGKQVLLFTLHYQCWILVCQASDCAILCMHTCTCPTCTYILTIIADELKKKVPKNPSESKERTKKNPSDQKAMERKRKILSAACDEVGTTLSLIL